MTPRHGRERLGIARQILRMPMNNESVDLRSNLVVRESLAHKLANARLQGRDRLVAKIERAIHGLARRTAVAVLAVVPTFVPTSAIGHGSVPFGTKNSQAIGVASLNEATPQVGFEPTTLRLTEGQGHKSSSSLYKVLAATPLIRRPYGSAGVRESPPRTPRTAPRLGARRIAHHRGYWSAAPPDSARGNA